MVLAEESGQKATEHPHQSKFVLGVRIATVRVGCNSLYSTFPAKQTCGLYKHWRDALFAAKMTFA